MKNEKPTKPRGVWKINPKTRVKPSEKVYDRPKEKEKEKKSWASDVDWFGTGSGIK